MDHHSSGERAQIKNNLNFSSFLINIVIKVHTRKFLNSFIPNGRETAQNGIRVKGDPMVIPKFSQVLAALDGYA